ncbi:MAG: DUF58 domain-containing protein [Acidobacteria bacterium]|nr:DUF58 domain-containing protein [Acidobacteriota bacterium]
MADRLEAERAEEHEFLERLRYVEIVTRRRIQAHLIGESESSVTGPGLDFRDHKLYQKGDDYRRIDWNATSRFSQPLVKRYFGDKEITAWLILDLSSSMYFRTGFGGKVFSLIELVASLAFSASCLHIRTGLIGFSDQVEIVVAPKRGRKVWEVLRAIPRKRARRGKTGAEIVLRDIHRRVRRNSMIFFISDFIGLEDIFQQPEFKYLVRHHDFIPVVLEDPLERQVPQLPGLYLAADPESGHRHRLYFSKRNSRAWNTWIQERKNELVSQFYRMNLDYLWLNSSEEDFLNRVGEFFIRRKLS